VGWMDDGVAVDKFVGRSVGFGASDPNRTVFRRIFMDSNVQCTKFKLMKNN